MVTPLSLLLSLPRIINRARNSLYFSKMYFIFLRFLRAVPPQNWITTVLKTILVKVNIPYQSAEYYCTHLWPINDLTGSTWRKSYLEVGFCTLDASVLPRSCPAMPLQNNRYTRGNHPGPSYHGMLLSTSNAHEGPNWRSEPSSRTSYRRNSSNPLGPTSARWDEPTSRCQHPRRGTLGV